MVRGSFIQGSRFTSMVMLVRYEIVRKHHQGLLTGFDPGVRLLFLSYPLYIYVIVSMLSHLSHGAYA